MDIILPFLIATTIVFFVIASIVKFFTKSNKAIVYSLLASILIVGGITIWSHILESKFTQPYNTFDCGEENGATTKVLNLSINLFDINPNRAVLERLYEDRMEVARNFKECSNLNKVRVVLTDTGAESTKDRFGNVIKEAEPYVVQISKADFNIFMKYATLLSVLEDFGSGIQIKGPYKFKDGARKGQEYKKLTIKP